jgi:hypothetical protein
MTRTALIAALAAVAAGNAAASEGAIVGAPGVMLQRGALGAMGTERRVERGVAIYRGPRSLDVDLAGSAPAANVAEPKTVTVKVNLRPRRVLRTQGFYAGHPGYSRRFTQGFYSGPVDFGSRAAVFVRVKSD